MLKQSTPATLIYNQNAGGVNEFAVEELQQALSEVGYQPVYRATSKESDLDSILQDIKGLVVAAGGDGTIRAVATRLIGKKNVALSALPLGTANNICRALDIQGKPGELVAGLGRPVKRRLDVGLVRAPWGEDYFLEATGCGFYADVLSTYDPEEGKSIPRALQAFIQTLHDYQAHPCRLTLDGRDISGDYLWMEVLNTPATGPRMQLAPNASPEDGLLDVVCVGESHRVGFLSYFKSLLTGSMAELPNVEVYRGRKLEWEWDGIPVHVDGEVRPEPDKPPEEEQPGSLPLSERQPARGAKAKVPRGKEDLVTIEVIPRALEFWLPQPEQST